MRTLGKREDEDVAGTPNWMAPEVITLKGASTASDVWSLGCTIVELLTGAPPYGDMLPMSAMFRIVEDDCPPLPPHISAELHDFLVRCFAKDPSHRPSASDLFKHVWLRHAIDLDAHGLRAQDSLPFLKRVSVEVRRTEIEAAGWSMSAPPLVREGSSPGSSSLMSHSPHQGVVVHDYVSAKGTRPMSVDGVRDYAFLSRPEPILQRHSFGPEVPRPSVRRSSCCPR